jgi:uncharacterized protein YkwD
MLEAASRFEPVLLMEPSNTPFLPARDTPVSLPTDPPTATLQPTAADTVVPTVPWTATVTAPPLPTVTPVTPKTEPAPAKILPTVKPDPTATAKPKTAVPTATEKPKAAEAEKSAPTATATATPTATSISEWPYPPPDETDPEPTESDPGEEISPSPTASPTPSPTGTPVPTATRTNTPVVPNSGCAAFNFEWEAQVAELLNQERAKYGLPPWRLNSILTSTARAHSVDMVTNKFMSHTGSDGRTPKQRIADAGYIGNWWGEIIAGGNPTIAVNWWMNEPGHRAQIINTHYTDFGVGYAYCYGQGWFTVDQGGP